MKDQQDHGRCEVNMKSSLAAGKRGGLKGLLVVGREDLPLEDREDGLKGRCLPAAGMKALHLRMAELAVGKKNRLPVVGMRDEDQ